MKRLLGVLATCLATIGTANATLINRGGGLIYDSVLNITWLADANLAASNTFGQGAHINPDGSMDWDKASRVWIGHMNEANYLGFNDWRLPISVQPDTACSEIFVDSFLGTVGHGYNCTRSEMGHLFYNELGGVAGESITTTHNANYSLFQNIQDAKWYWTATVYSFGAKSAFDFTFSRGIQGTDPMDGALHAWAVRDGDVPAIPEPGTCSLMLAGLALIGFTTRCRKQTEQ
jgi:hypothetical protein